MAFKVPTFNLTARVWSWAAVPPDPFNPALLGAHRLDTECQLRFPGKLSTAQDERKWWNFGMQLLVPKGTDLRDDFSNPLNNPDVVEVPQGSGRYYTIVYVDDVGKGFSNEYRFADMFKRGPWPTPLPA